MVKKVKIVEQDKPMTFHLSIKKRDYDLAALFSQLEKGERSEFARILMREGIKYRLEKQIPLTQGSSLAIDMSSISNAMVNNHPVINQSRQEGEQLPQSVGDAEISDNSTIHGLRERSPKDIKDMDDVELDALLKKNLG